MGLPLAAVFFILLINQDKEIAIASRTVVFPEPFIPASTFKFDDKFIDKFVALLKLLIVIFLIFINSFCLKSFKDNRK